LKKTIIQTNIKALYCYDEFVPKYPVINYLKKEKTIIENELTAIPGCPNAGTDT
jgi:hypothetical protein